jgi:hypothetical protein
MGKNWTFPRAPLGLKGQCGVDVFSFIRTSLHVRLRSSLTLGDSYGCAGWSFILKAGKQFSSFLLWCLFVACVRRMLLLAWKLSCA